MEVKTDPSVNPDTPTHQLCHLGTLLNLTEIQLPFVKGSQQFSLRWRQAQEAAHAAYLAQHLVQVRAR